jgi:pimeloyl-ACP methyl ester carboxylesterase
VRPAESSKVLEAAYRGAKFLELTWGRVCLVRHGEGPAVMLLHGIPLSLLTWRRNLAALGEFTVVALDLKGFGRSSKPPGDYRPEAHAQVVRGVLDALGLPSASLVASSYACAPALLLSLLAPERVDRLVLLNGGGYADRRPVLERLVRRRPVARMVGCLLRSRCLGGSIFHRSLRSSYAAPQAVSPEVADAYLELFRHDAGVASFLATVAQFDEQALARRLPEVRHETLLLWGERDRTLPLEAARRLQAVIRGSQLEIIPAAGHLPHEEAPERVNPLLRDFLRRPASSVPAARAASGSNG